MSLIVEKHGAVGWIVFNQPAKRNAINGAMWRGIPKAMAQYDADPEKRVPRNAELFRGFYDWSDFDDFSHTVKCQKNNYQSSDEPSRPERNV